MGGPGRGPGRGGARTPAFSGRGGGAFRSLGASGAPDDGGSG